MMRCVVIGVNHHNTLGIIRSLGEMKINVDVIILGNEKSFVVKSRYISRVLHRLPNKEDLLELLTNIDEKEKAALIPSCDSAALLIDECMDAKPELNFKAPDVNGQCGMLKKLMNKEYVNHISEDLTIQAPKSVLYEKKCADEREFIEFLNDVQLKLPIVAKLHSSNVGGKGEIRVLLDTNGIQAFIEKLNAEKEVYYLIEKYIDKDVEYGIQGVAFSDGEVYIPGTIRKIRQSVVAR